MGSIDKNFSGVSFMDALRKRRGVNTFSFQNRIIRNTPVSQSKERRIGSAKKRKSNNFQSFTSRSRSFLADKNIELNRKIGTLNSSRILFKNRFLQKPKKYTQSFLQGDIKEGNSILRSKTKEPTFLSSQKNRNGHKRSYTMDGKSGYIVSEFCHKERGNHVVENQRGSLKRSSLNSYASSDRINKEKRSQEFIRNIQTESGFYSQNRPEQNKTILKSEQSKKHGKEVLEGLFGKSKDFSSNFTGRQRKGSDFSSKLRKNSKEFIEPRPTRYNSSLSNNNLLNSIAFTKNINLKTTILSNRPPMNMSNSKVSGNSKDRSIHRVQNTSSKISATTNRSSLNTEGHILDRSWGIIDSRRSTTKIFSERKKKFMNRVYKIGGITSQRKIFKNLSLKKYKDDRKIKNTLKGNFMTSSTTNIFRKNGSSSNAFGTSSTKILAKYKEIQKMQRNIGRKGPGLNHLHPNNSGTTTSGDDYSLNSSSIRNSDNHYSSSFITSHNTGFLRNPHNTLKIKEIVTPKKSEIFGKKLRSSKTSSRKISAANKHIALSKSSIARKNEVKKILEKEKDSSKDHESQQSIIKRYNITF